MAGERSAEADGWRGDRRRQRHDEMLTIKMLVPYPARGTSPVRSLLRRAFDDFRVALEAGEMPEILPTYDELETTLATTRRISRRAYETAAQNIDPARLQSAFARLLARRARALLRSTANCRGTR